MELGQHAEFTRVMSGVEMLSRFFINDTSTASQEWRLKGHAVTAFWNWMASWTRMAEHPRDMGDPIAGFDLIAARDSPAPSGRRRGHGAGRLFAGLAVSATDMHMVKRQTAEARAEVVAGLVLEHREPWIVWCDTDYESDALMRALRECKDETREVRGSHPLERKEKRPSMTLRPERHASS